MTSSVSRFWYVQNFVVLLMLDALPLSVRSRILIAIATILIATATILIAWRLRHRQLSNLTLDGSVVGGHEFTMNLHTGRFVTCCASMKRSLTAVHQYSLFKCIRQEVDDLHASRQSGGFFRISYSGTKKPPEDLDDADAIYEWLDERKVLDMEWQKIKDMMESARHLEMASKKADDD